MDQRFVMFSGANERAIIACCRHFKRAGACFSIISRPSRDKIFYTAYKNRVDARRTLDRLDADDMVRQIEILRDNYPADKLIYVPTAESVNRVMLEHRARFTASGLTIPLCDESLYATLSDKSTFNALAATYGILLPEPLDVPDNTGLPCVAKPKQEFSTVTGEKIYPQLLFTPRDLQDFSSSHASSDYFFQKYIDGESYYLLLFVSGGIVKKLWQKNLLQQAEGKSIISAEICTCPDEVVESQILTLLQSTGYAGFIMVEIMREKEQSYLIEANPRLWGPFELAVSHGFNPAWVSMSGTCPDAPHRPRRYFWLNGWLQNRASGKNVRLFLSPGQSPARFITRLCLSDIYLQRDTLRLFAHEGITAVKSFLKRRSSVLRSEHVTASAD